MRRARFLVILLFFVSPCFAQSRESQVDSAVQQFQAKNQVPAITVAVAMNGQIVYSNAFGQADIENNVKATPETLIRTGSIAKPISAVAAMTLVEAGKLDLDAPIQKYCPAFPQKQWTITQLMSHTSGIRHYKEDEIGNTRHYEKMSDGFAIFANDPLLFEPGTKYSYSTYGYTVVGCVIEGASGEKFADYLAQHVLKPAGMTHTIVDDFAIVPHRARAYSKENGKVVNAGLMDSSYKIPGGGLVSTAEDLVRFDLALMDGKILKTSTTGLMWTPMKLTDGKTSNYGLGFGVTEMDGEKFIAHSGSQQGCSTSMIFAPDKRFAVAVMANMDGVNVTELARTIAKMYLKQ